jgi:very-short-patch-repair endonuclease
MLKRNHSPSLSSIPARRLLLASRALSHRRSPTEPERLLWSALSSSKLGVAFRRQVVIGNAIADFFAPSLRLVIEVNAAHHRLRGSADARRDRNLARLGCEVLHIDPELVIRRLPAAVALIREAVERLRVPNPQTPSHPVGLR